MGIVVVTFSSPLIFIGLEGHCVLHYKDYLLITKFEVFISNLY